VYTRPESKMRDNLISRNSVDKLNNTKQQQMNTSNTRNNSILNMTERRVLNNQSSLANQISNITNNTNIVSPKIYDIQTNAVKNMKSVKAVMQSNFNHGSPTKNNSLVRNNSKVNNKNGSIIGNGSVLGIGKTNENVNLIKSNETAKKLLMDKISDTQFLNIQLPKNNLNTITVEGTFKPGFKIKNFENITKVRPSQANSNSARSTGTRKNDLYSSIFQRTVKNQISKK
jgi:hypothetical protein